MQRLKTRPQFQATLAGGIIARTAHFALHRLIPDANCPSEKKPPHASQNHFANTAVCVWIGALVPKRWARRAVTRNAIRRQIYAVAQHCAPHLPAAAYVVRLRVAFDRKEFVSASSRVLKRAVRSELEQLLAVP